MDKQRNMIIGIVIAAVVVIGGIWAFAGSGMKTETTPSPSAAQQSPAAKNIVETAAANSDFTTLVTAVKTAGLVETLSGPGPFTVFAPTNEAFAKLPAGTLDGLLQKPEELKKILTYHVVAGEVLAKDVVKLTSAKTVNGDEVKIATDANGGVTINGAKVVTTDIKTSNGVIHVIDSVLIPSAQ